MLIASCKIVISWLTTDYMLYSSNSPKVFSKNDQFICYHPPTETLYTTSKVTMVTTSATKLFDHLQPLRPQQENRNKLLSIEQVRPEPACNVGYVK